MKRTLLAASLLLPAAAGATSLESLSAAAEQSFLLTAPSVRPQVAAEAAASAVPPAAPATILETPVLRALRAGEKTGNELGRVNLSSQFDRNLFLLKETLGSRALDIGITADEGAKTRFLSFTDASGTTLGKIGSLSDLRGKGVDIRIDASTVYNFRVEVGSIFDDPVHKSILYVTPTEGTQGRSYDMTTGALLDDMRAQSAIVAIDGDEYWFFYGRDALTDGSGFAKTHSFLVTHEAGMSTKAWPIAESSLPLDTPTDVALGDTHVSMTRTSGGVLIVGSGN
ncbi:MAG: hypothetical protein ACHQ49_06610 [Elusimicrobiota bacterium]